MRKIGNTDLSLESTNIGTYRRIPCVRPHMSRIGTSTEAHRQRSRGKDTKKLTQSQTKMVFFCYTDIMAHILLIPSLAWLLLFS